MYLPLPAAVPPRGPLPTAASFGRGLKHHGLSNRGKSLSDSLSPLTARSDFGADDGGATPMRMLAPDTLRPTEVCWPAVLHLRWVHGVSTVLRPRCAPL
jgi:hypothetical protein